MYRSDGDIADLFREGPVRRTSRRIAERVGDYLHERVTLHSPVSTAPPEVSASTFIHERGRLPGELRRSWRVGEVVVELDGELVKIDVYTEDPVAPFVEFDTEPHLIVPRDPEGVLRFRDRRGEVVYAKVVHHPGTRGVHMMATALTEVAASWHNIGVEEVDRMAREYYR